MIPGGFVWDVYGDIEKLNPKELVQKSIENAQRPLPEPVLHKKEPPQTRISGFGTYIYPFAWIGEMPVQTPLDIALGNIPREFIFPTKAFDVQYKGRKIIVNKDGYIGVEATSEAQAAEFLNEIFGVLWLIGIEAYAVREFELGQISIEPSKVTIGGTTHSFVSLRSAPAFGDSYSDLRYLSYTRQKIKEEVLMESISIAENISADPFNKSALLFLLEAQTHLSSSEYRQCFVSAWLVIESWLQQEWERILDSKGVSKTRKQRLLDSTTWTAEVKSETLNLMASIETTELQNLSKMRKIRNRVVHDGYNPSQKEGQEILNLALRLFGRVFKEQFGERITGIDSLPTHSES